MKIIDTITLLLTLLLFANIVKSIQMSATENATIYLNPLINTTNIYRIQIFGNEENSWVTLTLLLDGDLAKYATIQEFIDMQPNPTGLCCDWYPFQLNITLPDNESLVGTEIRGNIFAIPSGCGGSGGSCIVVPSMKKVVLRPQTNYETGRFKLSNESVDTTEDFPAPILVTNNNNSTADDLPVIHIVDFLTLQNALIVLVGTAVILGSFWYFASKNEIPSQEGEVNKDGQKK